jgi:peptidyl-prolyl cis-trans isomerase C
VLAAITAIGGSSCSKEDGGTTAEKEDVMQAGQQAGVVAVVNGGKITEQTLEKEVDRMTQQYAGRVDPSYLTSMRRRFRKEALEHIINRKLLLETAEKEGITTTKEDVLLRLSTIMENMGSEENFRERLKTLDITENELKMELEEGIRIELLIDTKVSSDQPIQESELRAFYENNKQMFEKPEQVKASHILITVDKDDPEDIKAEKRKRLEGILIEIIQGADFGEMAAQYSDCPSKSNHGDLGYFGRGRMVPEFEEAAFALETGEVSDIVETQFGYHIIKVTDHQQARIIPFEEAQYDIESQIEGHKREEAIGAYIEKLRSEATISYADSSLAPDE